MAHPDHEVKVITLDGDATPEQLAELQQAMEEHQEAVIEYIDELSEQLGVGHEAASMISYLRGRSRWTQEKEDQLIALDKAGKPIPTNKILRGEF